VFVAVVAPALRLELRLRSGAERALSMFNLTDKSKLHLLSLPKDGDNGSGAAAASDVPVAVVHAPAADDRSHEAPEVQDEDSPDEDAFYPKENICFACSIDDATGTTCKREFKIKNKLIHVNRVGQLYIVDVLSAACTRCTCYACTSLCTLNKYAN